LLGASRIHGNVKVGGVIKWVLELELENALVYLLLLLNIARRMMFLFIIDLNPSSVTIVVCKDIPKINNQGSFHPTRGVDELTY
jgi:hypothetical protein